MFIAAAVDHNWILHACCICVTDGVEMNNANVVGLICYRFHTSSMKIGH
jgi:hypothetical protein